MLDWVTTPYGEMVPRVDGCLLVSKVNPENESKKWVRHHSQFLNNFNNVFIMGGGSGHHVLELVRSFPEKKFIVFEYLENLSHSPIYAEARTHVNLEMILGNATKTLFSNEVVREFLQEPFRILFHHSYEKTNKKYYQDIEDLLLGRSWRSFHQILSCRPEDQKHLVDLKFNGTANEWITIKDVIHHVSEDPSRIDESKMIWLALGELIR